MRVRPHTRLEFHLPRAAAGSLRILDVRGRVVRTLHQGQLAAGRTSVSWDGTNDYGRPLAAGVYSGALR